MHRIFIIISYKYVNYNENHLKNIFKSTKFL